jgi:hypothetical protein
MSGDDLRVGFEEREATMAALGSHFAAGRLTAAEYEDRTGRAAAAATREQVRPLFTDLPPPHPPFLETAALPEPLRAALAAEGTLILAERLPGEIRYRNYRAPGTHHRRRTVPVTGIVAVTGRRLLVWAADAKQVDVPFDHPLRAAIQVTAKADLLHITIDAGAVHPARSGRIEIHLRTTRATDVATLFGPGG